MMIRVLDILISFIAIIFFSPFFLIISILILLDSKGGILYFQERVGKNNTNFGLIKFRTMSVNSDKKGLLTVGENDTRITKVGKFLRKYKIDEIPQLMNVLFGNMSFVGPRPEVRKYVDLYTPQQRVILNVKPGITDYASIEYANENYLLGMSDDPEKTYIEKIMPEKIKLNMKYLEKPNIKNYLKVLYLTLMVVIKKK